MFDVSQLHYHPRDPITRPTLLIVTGNLPSEQFDSRLINLIEILIDYEIHTKHELTTHSSSATDRHIFGLFREFGFPWGSVETGHALRLPPFFSLGFCHERRIHFNSIMSQCNAIGLVLVPVVVGIYLCVPAPQIHSVQLNAERRRGSTDY